MITKIKNITFIGLCTLNVIGAVLFTWILRGRLAEKDNFKLFNHHVWYEYNFYVVLIITSLWLAVMLLPTYFAVMMWNKNYKKAYFAALIPLMIMFLENLLFYLRQY